MRPFEFRGVCQILWGTEGWAQGAADHLKVKERNVYYWAAGTKVIPAGVEEEIRREMQRRLDDPSDATPGLATLRSAIEGRSRAA